MLSDKVYSTKLRISV